ncbi:MAG: HD domain-containing protein [Eubacterium sp.]|nr:HD domain-containing protein [Eubacterium sp.]
MKIQLPASVNYILDLLHSADYEAYAVGGCIRDSILGREPNDWDITTSARPEEVKKIFRRTVDTGIQHGTVTVLVGDHAHEVTTYRVDGEYKDGRHPESVAFTASLAEDLKRRDFTINAMAYNEEDGLVDLYGGMEDIQKGVIRCVGDPEERFTEDALRILRAMRFAAQLDFKIDRLTVNAVIKLAGNLEKISAERICTELIKLITSGHPEYLKGAYEAGITRIILPEFDRMMETPQHNPHHCYNVGDHTIAAMQNVPAEKILRLTMLLHDIGKPLVRTTDERGIDHFKTHAEAGSKLAEKILRRLKLDNDTIDDVKTLILYHDWRVPAQKKAVRRALNKIGERLFPSFLLVQRADALAQSDYQRQEKLERIEKVKSLAEEILEEKECFSLKDLAVTGRDLIEWGIPKGPEIGRLLHVALDAVIDEPSVNTKEWLKKIILANR